jgi:hypothetical protein
MSFLVLNNGKVEFTEEGKTLPAVIELNNRDKHQDKRFFDDTATYIFYVYKKEGVYTNKLPTAKRQYVIEKHLPNRKVSDFENNITVKKIIDLYIELQFTPVEQLGEGLKRDIEDLLKRVGNIEYEKEVMVEFDAEVIINNEKEVKHFRQKVVMDNSAEKDKAMATALKLMDFDEKLTVRIFKEKKDKKRTGLALFDVTQKP